MTTAAPAAAEAAPTTVEQEVPTLGRVELGRMLEGLAEAEVRPPFDPSRTDFVADLARRLGRRARGQAETQALAYWMRRTEVQRLAADFARLTDDRTLLVPRGTVFHIPPANVDTMFVYSWVLSVLVGNRNIVRLSSRGTEQSRLILEVLRETLADHPDVARTNVMLTYGHDAAVTQRISASCDVRVVWGGDETVRRVRAVPLPPHATELVFPDRFSMAALGTDAYRALGREEREQLAESFFNDAYLFDQLGCSSARLVMWVGEQSPGDAADDFFDRVRDVARRKGYQVDAAASLAKLGHAYRSMIDHDVVSYRRHDEVLDVLDMGAFPDARGDFCGAGLFHQVHVTRLRDAAPHIRRKDQTLTVFGLAEADVREFLQEVQGRGIDRVVPFGQALTFSRFWDGYDLLVELTRKTTVDLGTAT